MSIGQQVHLLMTGTKLVVLLLPSREQHRNRWFQNGPNTAKPRFKEKVDRNLQ